MLSIVYQVWLNPTLQNGGHLFSFQCANIQFWLLIFLYFQSWAARTLVPQITVSSWAPRTPTAVLCPISAWLVTPSVELPGLSVRLTNNGLLMYQAVTVRYWHSGYFCNIWLKKFSGFWAVWTTRQSEYQVMLWHGNSCHIVDPVKGTHWCLVNFLH